MLYEVITVEERGLRYDRRWMLVDETNRFITQRSYPQMALIKVEKTNSGLLINHNENILPMLSIQHNFYDDEEISVQIWRDNVPALSYNFV